MDQLRQPACTDQLRSWPIWKNFSSLRQDIIIYWKRARMMTTVKSEYSKNVVSLRKMYQTTSSSDVEFKELEFVPKVRISQFSGIYNWIKVESRGLIEVSWKVVSRQAQVTKWSVFQTHRKDCQSDRWISFWRSSSIKRWYGKSKDHFCRTISNKSPWRICLQF